MAQSPSLEMVIRSLSCNLEAEIQEELKCLNFEDNKTASLNQQLERLEIEYSDILKVSSEKSKVIEDLKSSENKILEEKKEMEIHNQEMISKREIEREEHRVELLNQKIYYENKLNDRSKENEEKIEKTRRDLEEEFNNKWISIKSYMVKNMNNMKEVKEDFKSELAAKVGKINALKEKLANKDIQIESLNKTLEEQKSFALSATVQVETLTSEITQIDTKFDKLQGEHFELDVKLADTNLIIDNLRNELNDKNEKIDKLEGDLSELSEQLADKNLIIDTLRNELDDKNEKRDKLLGENSELNAKLADKILTIDTLKNNLIEQKSMAVVSASNQVHLKEEICKIKAEIKEQLEEKELQFNSVIDCLQRELADQEEMKIKESEMFDTNLEQFQKLKSDYLESENLLNDLKNQQKSLSARIETLLNEQPKECVGTFIDEVEDEIVNKQSFIDLFYKSPNPEKLFKDVKVMLPRMKLSVPVAVPGKRKIVELQFCDATTTSSIVDLKRCKVD